MDHLFLHCKVARWMWTKLFQEGEVHWIMPPKVKDMIDIGFTGFEWSSKGECGKCLWDCVVMAVLGDMDGTPEFLKEKRKRFRFYGIA